MIRRTEKIEITPPKLLGTIAPPERIIFFDIETTGLRAGKSNLYLIGTVTLENGAWELRQFFSESMLDEQEVLRSFSEIIESKRKYGHPVLVTYNGEGFDIGYLRETAREYHLPDPFTETRSFDLYKEVKPFKKLTGLPDLKLKSVEKLFGIRREDRYSGGDLIAVYEEYLRLLGIPEGGCEDIAQNHALKEKLLSCLLLHNEEDVRNLPLLTGLCAYRMLSEGEMTLEKVSVDGALLSLRFRLSEPLPAEISFENESYTVSVSGKDRTLFSLTAALFTGELRFFYQDYKNYYYLPAEDMAVHKSVGEFVDRKSRKQATASTCYVKKEGTFLPEPEPVFTPVFHRTYKGDRYALLSEEMLRDSGKLSEYALRVLFSFPA